MNHIYCRQCGFVIILGGSYADQQAKEHGFCSEACFEVYEAIKEIEKEQAV